MSAELYKFLRRGAVGPCSGFRWPVPRGAEPGEWVGVDGPPSPCRMGVHACRADQLPSWISAELWRIEVAGDVHEEEGFVVAGRGRLVSRVVEWDEGMAQDFAAACAAAARELADRNRSPAAAGVATDSDAYAFAARAIALGDDVPDEVAGDIAVIPAGEELGFMVAIAALSAARCAGEAAARERDERAYGVGFAAERERQGRWLAARLA